MPKPKQLAVIVTALPLEREAVCRHLRDIQEEPPLRGSIYRRGIFDEQSEPWDVVVAEIGAGNEGAAAEAERVIAHYSPRFAIFVGVAGAIKDLKHGDVVASTKVYDYESGKDMSGGFRPRPSVELSGYIIEQRARHEAGEQDWLKRIRGGFNAPAPTARVGPIAAGEKVLASSRSQIFKFLRHTYGDALAVEMEGHGFLRGVRMNHPTQGIVVRSISDLVEDKNAENDDQWQPIAARHAAAFAFQLLAKLPSAEGDGPLKNVAATVVQNAAVGDVSGSNITINIQQNQGLNHDDLTQFIRTVAPDANAEIDAACSRMNVGELDIAIHMFEEIRKKRWDKLTAREKYRIDANLGSVYEKKGEFRKAAQHYLDAKTHLPNDEKARAFEAIAYCHLGEKKQAHDLACATIKDHPNNSLAIAVRIRTTPFNVPFAEVEAIVPLVLKEDLEVLHALGWWATSSDDLISAERTASQALGLDPNSAEIKEQLAVIYTKQGDQARREGRPIDRKKLELAVEYLSASIAKRRGRFDEARLRYSRAEAHDLLGMTDAAETDFRASLDDSKDDPDIVRRFVLFLARHDRSTDTAIEILRQADKVKRNHINALMLSGLLGDRNSDGDSDEAIALLRETIPEKPEPELRATMVDYLARLLCFKNQHGAALSYIDGLDADFLQPAVVNAIRSQVLLRAKRKPEATTCAIDAFGMLTPDSPRTHRMRVADALGRVGEKKKALEQWKLSLEPDDAEVFIGTALTLAKEVGDDIFIMSFCANLRSAGVRYPFTLEMEVEALEKYGRFDAAIAIMSEYLAAPKDDDLARIFRVRLSLLGIRRSKPELIACDPTLLPSVATAPVKIGAAVAYVLRNGPHPQRGIEYAYELVRLHFDDPLARQAYVGVVGVGDDEYPFQEPTCVGPSCAVQYRIDDTCEVKWMIIEDAHDPRQDREEYSPGHSWATEMSGQGVGGTFHLRRDPIQSRTATILEIRSKYGYRVLEIMDNWETRFPDQFFVRKYTFPTNPDGSPDISMILKALDLREQQVEKMHSLYRSTQISTTSFSVLSGTGVLDSLSHLASDGTLPIRCCFGNDEERVRAVAALDSAETIVLDPSALATLFFSNQYEQLSLLKKTIVICERGLEEYSELRRKFTIPSSGFLGKLKGKYFLREDDPSDRARQLERLDQFLTKIKTLATLKTGEKLAELEPERRVELIQIFGLPTAEAIAEAKATGSVLWTDDLMVAEFGRERVSITKRVWTQLVFLIVAPKSVCVELTLFLLRWRYYFTRIDVDVVLSACREGSWDAESPDLRLIADWVRQPELIHEGAVRLCVQSLQQIWKQDQPTATKQAVARCFLRALHHRANGRRYLCDIEKSISSIFRGDCAAQGEFAAAINEVLKAEMKPANEASRAAWARILPRMQKKMGQNSTASSLIVEPTNKGNSASSKSRNELRKAKRKKKKR